MKNLLLMSMTVCCITFASCEKSEVISGSSEIVAEQGANASENAARQSFALVAENSQVEWWGSGPGASHHGSFAVTGQDIEVVNGKVKEGSFTIPIASIKNFDLPDHIKPILLDHLKSADFFDMVRYPEASFSFKKMIPLTKAVEGAVEGANTMVSGDFTMLGQTLAISFPARVVMMNELLTIEAKLKIDRTRWGMNYAADPALGDHHIYPEVDLHLKLQAQKQ